MTNKQENKILLNRFQFEITRIIPNTPITQLAIQKLAKKILKD
jgi:hypothetical protein